jgi:hypothetical protein
MSFLKKKIFSLVSKFVASVPYVSYNGVANDGLFRNNVFVRAKNLGPSSHTINSKNYNPPIKTRPVITHRGIFDVPQAGITKYPFLNPFGKFKEAKMIEERITPAWHVNDYGPICYADNIWNEWQSLKSRVIVDTPEPDEGLLEDFREDILENHKLLIPGMSKVKTTDIIDGRNIPENYKNLKPEQAVYLLRSNASSAVKATLLKTMIRLNEEGLHEDSYLSRAQCLKFTQRSSFLKMENLLYRIYDQCKDKTCRFISGAQAEFISLVGPWFMACQDRLKLSWTNDFFITFSSGKSNEEIGHVCESMQDNIFEDDISLFDVSVCKELLNVEYQLFKRWGAPRAVLALVKANMNTRGRTKHGFKYWVKATRKSGDPYTSLGNSLLNGLLHYYIYKIQHGLTTKQTIAELKMIVQGDDNLGAAPRRVDWVPWMLRFGFKSEALQRDSIFDAGFCSSRIYPTADGLVMGPCPGRVLSKLGYFVDKPKDATDKQLLRGTALGLYKQCYFIPPIKMALDKILRHTAGEKAVYTSYFKERGDWSNKTEKFHEPIASTWSVLNRHYYWTKEYQDKAGEKYYPNTPSYITMPNLETMFDLDSSAPHHYFR